MHFKLMIDDKEKTFSVPFVKGRIFRKALKMNRTLNQGELTEEVLNELEEFVCEVFENQFTPEQIEDGLPIDGLMATLRGVFFEVINRATSSIQGGSDTSKND
ncbi:phage tail assembly chaperone G [Neobacillus drentensis]|uniref:phage tail assembly chaperone G n=1 Tax=Neobacillus drentensis TaxID=220684 RepID=UPI002FFE1BD3